VRSSAGEAGAAVCIGFFGFTEKTGGKIIDKKTFFEDNTGRLPGSSALTFWCVWGICRAFGTQHH